MALITTNRDQPVRMSDVFGAPRNTPVNNPWLSGYWDNYAAREAAFQNPQRTYPTYGQPLAEEPQNNLQSALNANKDVYRPRPAPDGGDDFGPTREMPYNPEAILALDQNKWAQLGLLGLIPGGGVISAMNSKQAQNIRDDEMYSFLSDPSNRAESQGQSNTTDLGMDRSVADGLKGEGAGWFSLTDRGIEPVAAPYSTDQLASDMAALNNPDAPFSVAALDPSSYGMTDRDFEDPYPADYDFEDPYSGLLGIGNLTGVLGDMYSGVKGGVTDLTQGVLGLFADEDAPKSPDKSMMSDAAYAAAYGRANPRAGFSPATLAALAKQDAWAGGVEHGFGVGGPGDTSNMGVYGVDPTQPDGWGFLGTELEVQQNPNITQGPWGWGNYSGSSTGADYSGTPTGTSIVGPSNIYGGVNAGWEDDGGYSDPGGGVSSGAAAETLGDEGGWGPSF